MNIVCDFHIHSKYSRATSKDMTIEKIAEICEIKGIDVVATGDFVHPGWLKEIKEKLEEDGSGLLKLKTKESSTKFILSTEISSIYKKNGKTRKIHNLIIFPLIENAEKFSDKLGKLGNITSDGRPILGLDAKNLLEISLEISKDVIFIPAHIWTPWFSLFGQKSGFDSIEECFEELTDYIFALETGLSSDPLMNWRWSSLDRFTLVSNSDAHSPLKLGREATILNSDANYFSLKEALIKKDKVATIEFYPEEGKYHFDGHRKCNIRLSPEEAIAINNICPVCGNPLTMGVYHRIVELADREKVFEKQQDFINLVPLAEILSEIFEVGVNSKKIKAAYNNLIKIFGNELKLLKDVNIEEIKLKAGEVISVAIKNMRENKVSVEPGFDGEYGKISVISKKEKEFYIMRGGIFNDFQTKFKKNTRKNVDLKFNKIPTNKKNNNEIIANVDKYQQIAVNCNSKIVIIQAGPGTGKTYTLVEKVRFLVKEGAKPEEIAVITFTNKASEELKERINIKGIKIATFHKLGIELLKRNGVNFKIFSPEEQEKYFKNRDIANIISIIKKNKILIEKYKEYEKDFKTYQDFLEKNNLMDFDDIILKSSEKISEFPYKYVLVDEFQDIDLSQFELIKKFLENLKMLFVIGDKNQSIYGFRGCSNIYFDKLKNMGIDYNEITLKNNYRSCKEIIDFSKNIISKSIKLCATKKCKGEINFLKFKNENKEAMFICNKVKELVGGIDFHSSNSKGEELSFKDIAILFRVHFISRTIKKIFDEQGIPYESSKDTPLLETENIDFKSEKVKFLSFHAAKGLDFKVVFIIGCEDEIIPFTEDIDEEKRLLYVAVTRPESKLFLTTCNGRFLYGKFIENKVSRFLENNKFIELKKNNRKKGIFF